MHWNKNKLNQIMLMSKRNTIKAPSQKYLNFPKKVFLWSCAI